MKERRLRARQQVAPRRVRRPAPARDVHLHVDRPSAAPDEILDIVTGPFERAVGKRS